MLTIIRDSFSIHALRKSLVGASMCSNSTYWLVLSNPSVTAYELYYIQLIFFCKGAKFTKTLFGKTSKMNVGQITRGILYDIFFRHNFNYNVISTLNKAVKYKTI